jgi:hypothetical protein
VLRNPKRNNTNQLKIKTMAITKPTKGMGTGDLMKKGGSKMKNKIPMKAVPSKKMGGGYKMGGNKKGM